jgi:hypothetical protein
MSPLRIGTILVALASLLAIAAAPPRDPQTLRPLTDFAKMKDQAARSRALFGEVARVIQGPRCLNCHPVSRQPLQGDDMHPHSPAVSLTKMSLALNCRTCHHDSNTDVFAGGIQSIPGDPKWMLAPASMAWVGKTPAEICRQIKDPARNGNRTLEQLHEHMAKDGLVGWAWHPGRGRPPSPGTQAQFGDLVGAWIASGAECPAG